MVNEDKKGVFLGANYQSLKATIVRMFLMLKLFLLSVCEGLNAHVSFLQILFTFLFETFVVH
jgi:hypothetical protein